MGTGHLQGFFLFFFFGGRGGGGGGGGTSKTDYVLDLSNVSVYFWSIVRIWVRTFY